MAEALASVKRELGRDAVILQTRTLRKGGVFGFGGHEVVEITASADVNVLPRGPRRGDRSPQRERAEALARMFGGSSASSEAGGREEPPAGQTRPSGVSTDDGDFAAMMRGELGNIREMVAALVAEQRQAKMPELPEELFNAYLQLIESEVAEEMARQLIDSVRAELNGDADDGRVRQVLVNCVSRLIPTAGPVDLDDGEGPRLVALIGPTGVGKTTTIAKLAANLKLREGRRVGLITIDTYRIAAVNQLATYAQIIDVPLKVVLTPQEMTAALAELRRTCDVILMDTAGRSPQDQLKLNELRGFLDAARPDETHLVLSSTSTVSAMRSAVDRFSPLGVNRVILTKLDEAVSFGVILEVVRRVNASVSYVTTGQDVPEDIEVSEANRLARWIIDRTIASAQDETTTPPAGTAGRLEVTVDDEVGPGAPTGQGVGAHA
jgi:flagellar biosynthesis protein FlhF